jgi:exodeoxyribonuclease VII small subunit
MAKTETKPIEKLSYEEAYSELEELVRALESGEQSLDDALALFERGQMLTKRCAELLSKAELKIQTLTGQGMEPLREDE